VGFVTHHHLSQISLAVRPSTRLFSQDFVVFIPQHIFVAMAVAYAITGHWATALALSLIEPSVQEVALFVHEKIWQKVLRKRV
jgi:uncharacterized membrane protein